MRRGACGPAGVHACALVPCPSYSAVKSVDASMPKPPNCKEMSLSYLRMQVLEGAEGEGEALADVTRLLSALAAEVRTFSQLSPHHLLSFPTIVLLLAALSR